MRVSDKLTLIDKIGRELQARFGYGESDAFFWLNTRSLRRKMLRSYSEFRSDARTLAWNVSAHPRAHSRMAEFKLALPVQRPCCGRCPLSYRP